MTTSDGFYLAEQSAIHHQRFGALAARAADRTADLLRDAGLDRGGWTDLGCGSGILAARAAALGYDVTGIDISPDMVALARAQAPAARFVVGSVFDAELPPAVAVTAVGEVLGYAADPSSGPERLGELARRVRAHLPPGGVLLLDLAAPGRHEGRTSQVHEGDGWLLAMTATEEGTRLDRRISIFSADGDGWRRIDEHHVLRLYAPEQVVEVLQDAGYEVRVRPDYDDGAGMAGWWVYEAQAV